MKLLRDYPDKMPDMFKKII